MKIQNLFSTILVSETTRNQSKRFKRILNRGKRRTLRFHSAQFPVRDTERGVNKQLRFSVHPARASVRLSRHEQSTRSVSGENAREITQRADCAATRETSFETDVGFANRGFYVTLDSRTLCGAGASKKMTVVNTLYRRPRAVLVRKTCFPHECNSRDTAP